TTFGVGEGEFVAVVGPSGCGKSTLLKILAGILASSSGEALLRGTLIAGPRRDIGVVGVKRWGENSEANYAAYADFMHKYGIIKDKISAKDLITNDLIDAINRFDASKVAAEAKAYK